MTSIVRSLAVAFLSVALVAPVRADIPTVPASELHSDKSYAEATQVILHIIDTYHYKKKPLDDDLSSHILDNYLKSLDPNHSFFLESDIKDFDKYRYVLDDDMRNSDLAPAFKIFLRYRQRVNDRVDDALADLKQGFDFTKDESYQYDREDLPWPADEAAMKDLWRKRVKNDYLNLKLAGKKPEKITEVLTKRYERMRTSTLQLNANDVFQSFINAYTTSIEPHTAYFSPRTSENFDISMRLSLEGIGAVLSGATDYTEVQRVIPGGPADLSKQLHAHDRIIGVGQNESGPITDVVGWRLDDVVDLIRGHKGTVVRLEILPAGTGTEGPTKVISLTRDKIKLEEQEAQSRVIDLKNGGRIGVIDVPTFYSDFAAEARGDKNYTSTTRDVRKLLAKLSQENIDGVIIDLRGNGGGSLAEALGLTGLFIDSGPIVQTKDSTGHVEIDRDPDPGIVYGGPLAVLVDRNSASASEIFTGAIQDYHRGIIIGEPTFGKGTVQNIVDLNRYVNDTGKDLGKLKTTIAQFFRVSGGSNQFKGVVPDIIFPTARYDNEEGERGLPNALPWDHVAPAHYVPASAPVGEFSEVRRESEARIKTDPLFQVLLKELKLSHEVSERKSVSLQESTRTQERDTLIKARHALRNEYRKARGLPPLPDNTDLNAQEDADEKAVQAEDDASNDNDKGPPDAELVESARILMDLIHPGVRTASQVSWAKPSTAGSAS